MMTDGSGRADDHDVSTPARTAETGVAADVARAVQNVDGVLRLEPSVRDVFRLADPTRLLAVGGPRDQQGVSISGFGSITDLTVDVAVEAPQQALATARAVRDRAVAVLRDHTLEPGRISVNVLAIEYGTSGRAATAEGSSPPG